MKYTQSLIRGQGIAPVVMAASAQPVLSDLITDYTLKRLSCFIWHCHLGWHWSMNTWVGQSRWRTWGNRSRRGRQWDAGLPPAPWESLTGRRSQGPAEPGTRNCPPGSHCNEEGWRIYDNAGTRTWEQHCRLEAGAAYKKAAWEMQFLGCVLERLLGKTLKFRVKCKYSHLKQLKLWGVHQIR